MGLLGVLLVSPTLNSSVSERLTRSPREGGKITSCPKSNLVRYRLFGSLWRRWISHWSRQTTRRMAFFSQGATSGRYVPVSISILVFRKLISGRITDEQKDAYKHLNIVGLVGSIEYVLPLSCKTGLMIVTTCP